MPAAVVQGKPKARRSMTPSTSTTIIGDCQSRAGRWLAKATAFARGVDRQEVPCPGVAFMEGVGPCRVMALVEQLLARAFHRPNTGEQLLLEHSIGYRCVTRQFRITAEERLFFAPVGLELQDRLCEVECRISIVDFTLPHSVMFEIGLQEAIRCCDPLLDLHLSIDQRGLRAGTATSQRSTRGRIS